MEKSNNIEEDYGTQEEQANRFQNLLTTWPAPGSTLVALDQPVRVEQADHNGSSKMWTTMVIDRYATGWFLKKAGRGVKVMIDNDSHQDVVANGMLIKTVRVLRHANGSRAIVVEYVE